LAFQTELVEVSGPVDGHLLQKIRAIVQDRDDFESITDDHVVVWIHSSQTVDEMRRLGLNVTENYPDETRMNAWEAKKRSASYSDKPGAEPDWTYYCNYNCLVSRLNEIVATCPNIASLRSIGKTVRNRDIWVLQFTKAGVTNLPQVFLAGNIHGDETVGGQLLQRYAWDICNKYGSNSTLTSIVDRTNLFLLPMFNPDGYEAGTRANANGIDLNRDFPNTWTSPNDTTSGRQVETASYMNFTRAWNFRLSMMFHGGAIVANYPYDGRQPGTSGYSATNRDALVRNVSITYSQQNPEMYNNRAFPPDGTVNGAVWYVIYGSAQDFQYDYRGTIDITLEVSNNKWPNGNQLPAFYASNYNSINKYVEAVYFV